MIEMCVNASVESGEHRVNELDEDELLNLLAIAQEAISKSALYMRRSLKSLLESLLN